MVRMHISRVSNMNDSVYSVILTSDYLSKLVFCGAWEEGSDKCMTLMGQCHELYSVLSSGSLHVPFPATK